MNPDKNHYQPEVNLPPPVPEQAGNLPPDQRPEKALLNVEQESRAAELPQTGQQSPPTPPAPSSLPAAPPPFQATGSDNSSARHQISPAAADDVDLIEKEWVLRAKSIVERTKDDPHQQNQEMNKFKADYIKKRYNKEIKVSED